MTGWAARRFWKTVGLRPAGEGLAVVLDGRPVRTPAKAPLVLPTEALAQAIAAEWEAQTDTIRPGTMPLTRAANSTIDKVVPQRAEVAAMLSAYGGTDLVCYRAGAPEELVRRQAEAWDPLLRWAEARLAAPLVAVTGVIHAPQPEESLARLRHRVDGLDAFGLTALHDLVTLSGSLVLGLAAIDGAFAAEDLWEASVVDERWQAEVWGRDAEAEAAAEAKRADFLQAARFFRLARDARIPAPGSVWD